MPRAVGYIAENIVIFAIPHNQHAKIQKILHICNTCAQKFTQNDQNHEKIYAEWHNSFKICTQNDITHPAAAQKYIQFVCFPFALLLSKMCVPCSFSFIVLYGFYGSYGYFYPSASVCFRVFRVVCFIRTRSLTDFHGVLFTCIRLIRVIRGLICSVRILRILRNLCSSASVWSVGCFVLYGFNGYYGYFVHLHPCFSVCSV